MRKGAKRAIVAAIIAAMSLRTNYADAAYNGRAAIKYAERWYGGYNLDKYYNAGLDCTNFVSQCLVAGGKTPSSTLPSYTSTSHWRPHSATWENATYWRKYWKDKTSRCGREFGNNKLSTNNDLYFHLNYGDVIQWGYSKTDIRHSQLVQRFKLRDDGIYTCYMIQHTSGLKDIDLYDYFNTTSYTYVCGYHFSAK